MFVWTGPVSTFQFFWFSSRLIKLVHRYGKPQLVAVVLQRTFRQVVRPACLRSRASGCMIFISLAVFSPAENWRPFSNSFWSVPFAMSFGCCYLRSSSGNVLHAMRGLMTHILMQRLCARACHVSDARLSCSVLLRRWKPSIGASFLSLGCTRSMRRGASAPVSSCST